MEFFMKSLFLFFLVTAFLTSANAENDISLFRSYYNASNGGREGVFKDNASEISLNAIKSYGVNSYFEGGEVGRISFVEGVLKSDYIFLGNIKSNNPQFNIETYDEIIDHFEKRKSLESAKLIENRLKGNFNHLASSTIYEGAGYNMNDAENVRSFKNFNQHSLVATALYSCDAELTNYLIKKGLSDTFVFFKTYNHFRGSTEPGEAVYNHHRVVTPFNNFMSCLSLNGYWQGSEWINYPEGNPIQPYMEAFVKKMITHYLNKPELNLNEFGCYPVIKDYAYENFEWVRKMFTDKYGPDFAERCERNYQAWEDSCKSIDLPNGGRTIKCSLRKY